MSKSFLGKRSWHKKLAVAVTAGLMSGMYIPGVFAAEYNRNDTGISVDFKGTSDADWLGSNIVSVDKDGKQINVKYSFDGDNSFNITGTTDATVISIIDDPNVVIDVANGGTLKLNSSASVSGSNASAAGLSIAVEEVGANVTVNGNLDIAAHSNSAFASGISMGISGTGEGGEAHLTINGDVTMRNKDNPDSPWGVTAKNIHGGLGPDGWAGDDGFGGADYTGARWAPGGISLGSGHGSTIDINGNVDLAVAGSAVVTNNYYADEKITDNRKLGIINLNGGNVTIDTPESTTETYYALANYGGTINVNMDGDQAGANDVNITGNIISMKEDNGSGRPYFYADGQINLALATANSSWTGVIDNSGVAQAGEVNLYLQNGASWQHESLSKTNGMQVENMPTPSNDHYGIYDNVSHVSSLNGGSDVAHAGYIMQKDSAKIAVDNYSGHTVVVYEHENDGDSTSDYKAGDLIIKKAAAASGITLSTNNSGITMSDSDLVSRVLNTLAGKLTYSAFVTGETNLSGKVQIADGLTSSSAAMKVGNITFNEATGKGGYVSEEQPEQPKTDFTTAITGVEATDTEYADAGIIQEDGSYKFMKDSSITMTDGTSAIDVKGDVVIDAAGSSLTLKTDGSNNVYGISQSSGNAAKITADTINIDVTSASRAEGIHLMGSSKEQAADVELNGDVNVNVSGVGYTLGVYAAGNSTLNVNGNMTMKGSGEDKWGIDDAGAGYGYYGSSALYAGSNYVIQKGGTINVNGSVDLVVNGNGAFANGGGSAINIDGGSIEINSERQLYALIAQSGYINMNMNDAGDGAGSNKVNIKGNVGVMNGSVNSNEPCKDSIINLGLSTKDSTWTGVIDNNFTENQVADGWTGTVNLYMSNGATWTNEAYGKTDRKFSGSTVENFVGGASVDKAGNIFQKDSNALTFNNYSGYTNIYYAHDNAGTAAEDYKAGDTIVKHAATGSGISLITDNSGITISDKDQVNSVLNALAGKLTYSAYTSGEKNLAGKVQIADGLTSSSVAMKVGNITFDETTGKGGYVSEEQPEQPKTDFTTAITGVEATDTEYADAGIIQEDGSYKFAADTNIIVDAGTTVKVNTGIKDTNGGLVIDAANHELNLAINSTAGTLTGIAGVNDTVITADKVNINVKNLTNRAQGISGGGTINGDVNINVHGVGYALGTYVEGSSVLTINGNLTMKGEDGSWGVVNPNGGSAYQVNGIYAGALYGSGSAVNVNGDVDLAINGTGVHANCGGAVINLNGGGNILINKEHKSAHYSLAAENGTINMNVEKDGEGNVTGAGDKAVNISGNLGLLNGAVHSNDPTKISYINLGLTTSDSILNGVIVNTFTEANKEKGYDGQANIYLQNGATWNNEAYGKTSSKFTGSTVENFVGGSTAAKAGNIFQKDSNALTFNNYSGYTNIYYAHDNAGTAAEDYKAGDTIVKTAAADSGITLITDNSGITISDKDQVNSVLNALAGKLTYSAYTGGEKNLTGKVQIADGLTSSSATLKVGDITFDNTTGKGNYGQGGGEPVEPEPGISFGGSITGDTAKDKVYVDAGVTEDGRTYEFTSEEGIVSIKTGDKPAIDSDDKDFVVNAVGLELRADGGIQVKNSANVTVEVDKLQIHKAEGKAVYVYGSNLDVNGQVDISAVSDAVVSEGKITRLQGVMERITQSDVNIDGGKIKVESGNALSAKGGKIKVNVDSEGKALNNEVMIDGNITAEAIGSQNPTGGTVDLALTTEKSYWNGTVNTDSRSKFNLTLQNGASWTNESAETVKSVGAFTGSTVENFVGGASADKAGNIFQKDSNNLTFNNYSGYTNIYYAHDNAGAAAEDYKAGDTIVKNAAEGSGMSLITDNSNIDMKSTEAIETTLSALAQKLTYEAYKEGEKNLTGKVQIADGLTSSSAALQTGDIEFAADGKGGYVDGSLTPGAEGDNPGGDVEIGNYESDIMKGARSAMMTSMLSWRDNAADIYSRGSAVRDGAEEGAWARSFGGKAKYDGSSTSMENSYWAGQVGYDRMLANGWTLGAAIDYRDGNATYLNGGKGDNKLYSFGIYASKELGDNAYLDMAVKAGKVENEYSVYNIIGQKLDGDYSTRGYSVSAQYSKRFGEETKGYVEPQLQLTWSRLDSESYTTHSGSNVMNIRQDAFNSFVGRIGVQTGVETERGGLFAKLSVVHEFSGDVEGSYNANDGGLKTTKYDLGGTWSELTLGGSYKLSKCSNFYADITRSLSGDYQHQWKLNAGLNFSF